MLTIEKVLLAGLGSAVLAKERVDEVMEKLVNKGELSRDQATKVVDELTEKGQAESEKVQARGRTELQKFFAQHGLAFADDVKRLETRIEELTARVETLTVQMETPEPVFAVSR